MIALFKGLGILLRDNELYSSPFDKQVAHWRNLSEQQIRDEVAVMAQAKCQWLIASIVGWQAASLLILGLIANYPIALAPGMGLNAFFTYTVVLHMGHTWQVALGAVFISAVLFFLLSIFRIREWIINSIPLPLRSAIAAGIGLFLAIIALQKSGVIVGNEDTLVALGPLNTAPPLLFDRY